ncbi:MAG TPA: condensation domain-containing protein [Blastocatellia bacterium]
MKSNVIEGYHLSPQQRRIWKLAEKSSACRVQCEISIEGAVEIERLKEAIAGVIARHEILRTTFYRLPGWKSRSR